MGVYTEIEVQITVNEEDTDKAHDILANFNNEIKEHIVKDKAFHADDLDEYADTYGFIETKIASGRSANAHWQLNCLVKLFQIHQIEVLDFDATILQPESIMYFENGDDFNEYEPNLT